MINGPVAVGLDALLAPPTAVTQRPADEIMPGVGGIAEGTNKFPAGSMARKFREGGLMIVRAGGGAGMFSGIIGGWSASGERGSSPVTKEINL